MRYCKLFLMGGIVLALSMPAWGLSLLQPYNGPMTMQLANWDEGTVYHNLTNDVTYDRAALDLLPTTDPGSGGAWRSLAINGGGSDTWGVIRIDNIYSTEATPKLLFDGIGGPTSLTAIFYGEQDTYVRQTVVEGNTVQFIHGTGMKVAFYEQPMSTSLFDPMTNGPSTGWGGTAGGPSFTGVTDGSLVWTMLSAPGNNSAYPTDEFFESFFPGDVYNSSNGKVLFNMTTIPFDSVIGGITGPQNWQLDTNSFLTAIISTRVDVTTTFTASSDPGQYPDIGNWLIRSSDPFNVNIIPEPATMAGLLLGIGCLGRYIRKRR